MDKRLDTSKLFENMTQKTMFSNDKKENIEQETLSAKPRGRKPLKEKNIQVSIYLHPEQAKELRLQDALKEKEKDKSAIARTGIDIALQMSSKCYRELKKQAQAQNIQQGKLVEEALNYYFNKK